MSTNVYNGFFSDKPSSKVRAPPGGRSNNIFGVDDDQTNKPKPQQKENVRPISNIFGAPVEQDLTASAKKVDRMKSSIFGADTESHTTTCTNGGMKKKRSGINPITGKPYEDDEEENEKKKTLAEEQQQPKQPTEPVAEQQPPTNKKEIHTSSKVLQPPGGKCSKLW